MLNCEDIKVSLVVPVYNIEKYLPKNIESLIKQNLNMEIIYVDKRHNICE
jgi:glycosyltransferase involved in cell wall biosynthesis